MAYKLMYTIWACVICFVGFTVGSGYDAQEQGLTYGGQFLGKCDSDGMYYMDDSSYVMCSHSIAYIMPCAPGSRNSGRQLDNMQIGESFGFTAFCDVNLVDLGYAAFASQQAKQQGYGDSGSSGYQAPAPSYQAPAPSYQAPAPSYQPTYSPPAPSYQPPKPSYQNIVITYKQPSASYAPAPKPAQTKKSSYTQQQRSPMGYGYASARSSAVRSNPYGQLIRYGNTQPKPQRNVYNVGGYNYH